MTTHFFNCRGSWASLAVLKKSPLIVIHCNTQPSPATWTFRLACTHSPANTYFQNNWIEQFNYQAVAAYWKEHRLDNQCGTSLSPLVYFFWRQSHKSNRWSQFGEAGHTCLTSPSYEAIVVLHTLIPATTRDAKRTWTSLRVGKCIIFFITDPPSGRGSSPSCPLHKHGPGHWPKRS